LDASSIRNLSLSSKSLIENPSSKDIKEINSRLAQFRFQGYHFVHGHSPLTCYAPENFFKFIILRNPIDRVISQILDWQRLEGTDLVNLPPQNRLFKLFTKKKSIYDIVKKWDSSELSRLNLSNMQTRLVFKSKMGLEHEFQSYSKKDQLKIAKEGLLEYDLIGITEEYNATAKELCILNKWCPPKPLTKLNSRQTNVEVDKKALDLLTQINNQDIELYEEALEVKTKKWSSEDYTIEEFELKYAEERTQILTPVFKNNTYLFDFNMPIIGNGFHFRDAENTSECAVWTGPSKETSLFFPVLAMSDINILLYIKGYADQSVKKTIEIEIDGNICEHKHQHLEGIESVLVVRHLPKKKYVHIKMRIDKVFASLDDKRLRGISLLKYGFSCNI